MNEIEKPNQRYLDEQEYIEARKDYWDKFNKVALNVAPEFETSLYHGSYDEERYSFEFDQYEDAQALKTILEERGFTVVIKEQNHNRPTNGRKYFEVTQEDFVARDNFKK